jgi:hypothetical protein
LKTFIGKVAEWFKAFVLKTKEEKFSGGSNPLLSVTNTTIVYEDLNIIYII